MIKIRKAAKDIKKYLENKGITSYKIYIRTNLSLDVFYKSEVEGCINELFEETTILKNNRICFHQLTDEDLCDPYYENMRLEDDNHIVWGPRYRFDSFLSNNIRKGSNLDIPIVTFYSYKGGMGRTTTMIAYAIDAAINNNKKVVILDCDLEAPGYLNFFDLSEHGGLKDGDKNGLVEYLCDVQFSKDKNSISLSDYVINVRDNNNKEWIQDNEKLSNLWIVPAGNLNEIIYESGESRRDYLEGLAHLNLSNVENLKDSFISLFKEIKEQLSPDIILIDSRTGFNDVFGTTAICLAKYVVGFFGFSRQTQPGLIHLLREYIKEDNQFNLLIVPSIIPQNVTSEWLEDKIKVMNEAIDFNTTERKNRPQIKCLQREPVLEKIGTGDDSAEKSFIDLIKKKDSKIYQEIFDTINEAIFIEDKEEPLLSPNTNSLNLRNVILRHLQKVLKDVRNFAEDTKITESQFFYRECMKQFLGKDALIIEGYKGTGKTYLYKALTDPEIRKNVQKWAGQDETDSIFINILPVNDNSVSDRLREITDEMHLNKEAPLYVRRFWRTYSWNEIMRHPEFSEIRGLSPLSQQLGVIEDSNSLMRLQELIRQGLETQAIIDADFKKINDFLITQNKKMYVMYDRLDSCVNPIAWNTVVSPLIEYWRNNNDTYSNISPRIFVRTDLFRRITGTNTARLKESIVSLEWSIGEVFAYLFKLIFSDKHASNAFWAIAEKVGIDSDYIQNTKTSFAKTKPKEFLPANQFRSMEKAAMKPLIRVFFGKRVEVNGSYLGEPWDYFKRELSNADNNSISLRPFINTLNENAVNKALKNTDRYVKQIISPDIYASKDVREHATNTYFEDLANDRYSEDLNTFRQVIREKEGERFRYKSLNENLFKDLIETTFRKIHNSEVVKSTEDLKSLIFANGIMAEKVTTKGYFYSFAPIYWYTWGLVNSELENEENRGKSKRISNPENLRGKIKTYSNQVQSLSDNTIYRIDKFNGFSEGCSKADFNYDDEIYFNLKNVGNNSYAINIRPVKE